MSNPRAQTSDELETVEAQNSLFDLLYDGSARAVTTRLGQFVYRRVDSLLSIVEKTARWSLPQSSSIHSANDDPNKISISAPPLVRPLPWLLFLPALIALRLIRVALSFLALMLGKPPVYPATVVGFLQNRRRKLRALKYHGQRLNRIIRSESQAGEESRPTWLNRVTLPIRTVVSTRASMRQSSQEANHIDHLQQVTKKRNVEERDFEDSDDSFEDAACMDLLEKYANIDGDSSFNETRNGYLKTTTVPEAHLTDHEPPGRWDFHLAVALKAQISLEIPKWPCHSILFPEKLALPAFTSSFFGRPLLNKTLKLSKSSNDAGEASDESSDTSVSEAEKSTSEDDTTADPPTESQGASAVAAAAAATAGNSMNGHTETERSADPQAQPAEAEKLQKKSSLNVIKALNANISPSIERAEEAITENGSPSDPISGDKQDSKNTKTAPLAKTTLAAVAPEAVTANSVSMNNNNNKAQSVAAGEIKGSFQQQQKIRQHNQQPAPLQPQNYQQLPTVTANGGSGGGRKQKRTNQTYS
ncbi:uncharacterized protein LOC129722417 isoform X1 [Wyeomyia smithii]|uniref:uncharacterized protein LOC129722417 isoform X1 n=1 Tax=Wyeomyia smithii TaxID=174621 RepID=UPI002467F877|nr:uncharacterized protein LOC129722417 isoform X1 [Wyeomyia smithii]XP_055531819.1 uncharacterized protein LOC129722417 isoform X1 [Wyeomyia smithii]